MANREHAARFRELRCNDAEMMDAIPRRNWAREERNAIERSGDISQLCTERVVERITYVLLICVCIENT